MMKKKQEARKRGRAEEQKKIEEKKRKKRDQDSGSRDQGSVGANRCVYVFARLLTRAPGPTVNKPARCRGGF
jgi:hypothetical protein